MNLLKLMYMDFETIIDICIEFHDYSVVMRSFFIQVRALIKSLESFLHCRCIITNITISKAPWFRVVKIFAEYSMPAIVAFTVHYHQPETNICFCIPFIDCLWHFFTDLSINWIPFIRAVIDPCKRGFPISASSTRFLVISWYRLWYSPVGNEPNTCFIYSHSKCNSGSYDWNYAFNPIILNFWSFFILKKNVLYKGIPQQRYVTFIPAW